jgi:sulfite exporter TauE/SafE
MTAVDLTIPFGLGVVSSIHCAQMCGPLVLAQSPARPLSHVAYNIGRLATYSLLGAIAGATGGGLAHLTGIERTAALIAGSAMIVAALLLFIPRSNLVKIGGGMPRIFSTSVARLLRSQSAGSKLAMGAIMGFLPCGLLYAALIKAVDAGSAVSGALSMLAFGTGTAGALLSIGIFSNAITARLGRHANVLAAVSVLFVGAFLLWRGLHAPEMRCPNG